MSIFSSFACKIVELEAAEAEVHLAELADILVDAVESGASVSFMMPFSYTEALAYWRSILLAVADGRIAQGEVFGEQLIFASSDEAESAGWLWVMAMRK